METRILLSSQHLYSLDLSLHQQSDRLGCSIELQKHTNLHVIFSQCLQISERLVTFVAVGARDT